MTEDTPITIVSGLPRSGTSLMMQMLDAGGMPILTDGVREADRDNPRGYYELEDVKHVKQDHAWLDAAQGKAFKMVYLLLYDLPLDRPYRVILMQRDLAEVVESQDRMLQRLGQSTGSIPRDKLVAVFDKQLRAVKNWLQEQTLMKVLAVDYHQLVANPRPAADRVDAFLGGTLDVENMATVVDPELYRVRVGENPRCETSPQSPPRLAR